MICVPLNCNTLLLYHPATPVTVIYWPFLLTHQTFGYLNQGLALHPTPAFFVTIHLHCDISGSTIFISNESLLHVPLICHLPTGRILNLMSRRGYIFIFLSFQPLQGKWPCHHFLPSYLIQQMHRRNPFILSRHLLSVYEVLGTVMAQMGRVTGALTFQLMGDQTFRCPSSRSRL